MISVRNLAFRYRGQSTRVLDDLSLTVQDGEIVAVVGKNGSGKSTLGKIITGLTKFKSGTVTIDGLDLKSQPQARDRIGIVFQNPENQIIFSSIRDELSFTFKDLPAAEVDFRISAALDQVGMKEQESRDLYELSLGQKQRIMIAEALAKGSKNLVFDEPTTMIDSAGKEQIYRILQNLRSEGYATLLFTNLADEILLADHILILEHGRFVAEIARADLLKKADLLISHGIVLPTLLKLALALEKRGLKLALHDYTLDELATVLTNHAHNTPNPNHHVSKAD